MVHLRRLKNLVLVSLALALVCVVPAAAQQETRQVAPDTRNPQTNGGLPSQQQPRNVQTTESQQILNRNQTITIPSGQPAADPEAASRQQNQKARRLWLLSILSLVVAGVCFIVLRRNKSQAVPAEPPKTVPVQPPRKTAAKKKTTKAKPKSHRKHKRKV